MNDINQTPGTVECPNCSLPVQEDLLIPAGESMICASCRDEYMQRLSEGISVNREDEYVAIRQEHIKHEASLRSIGILYYIGGVLILFGGISMLVPLLSLGEESAAFGIGFLMFYLLLGIFFVAGGRAFRKLKRWVRVPSTILSAIGLINIPVGTLINGYILYLIWSEKGKMIFSDEYKEVMEATPEIKYRTSALAWIVLIVFVIILVGSIAFALTQ